MVINLFLTIALLSIAGSVVYILLKLLIAVSGSRLSDNTTYYSDHSTFCIIVDHNDRSYRYSDYRVEDRHDGWGTATEADLRAALDELGVPLPAAARFYDEGKGRYTFRAANLEQDGLFYDGSIECRVSKSGRKNQQVREMSIKKRKSL